jgi:hypothetical protein
MLLLMLERSNCSCLCWSFNFYEDFFKFDFNHTHFAEQSNRFCVACHVSEECTCFTFINIFEVIKALVLLEEHCLCPQICTKCAIIWSQNCSTRMNKVAKYRLINFEYIAMVLGILYEVLTERLMSISYPPSVTVSATKPLFELSCNLS